MPSRQVRGTRLLAKRLAPRTGQAGLTLIELIVAFSLMLILSLMAIPVARVRVQREKEQRLRHALQEMRVAIDRHKDMADQGRLEGLDPDNYGYPPSLEALVDGIGLGEDNPLAQGLGLGQSMQDGLGVDEGFGSERGGAFGSMSQRGFGGGSRSISGLGDSRSERESGRFEDPLRGEREKPEAIRFLRAIPVDPITGERRWGMLSNSDDPESRRWSGRNVFDVYSLSNDLALDGTRYSDW